jgi:hypothetical protein
VVQGQQRVGLASSEVGLQLDDRVPRAGGKPLQGPDQQMPQALSDVGPPVELRRVPVLAGVISIRC